MANNIVSVDSQWKKCTGCGKETYYTNPSLCYECRVKEVGKDIPSSGNGSTDVPATGGKKCKDCGKVMPKGYNFPECDDCWKKKTAGKGFSGGVLAPACTHKPIEFLVGQKGSAHEGLEVWIGKKYDSDTGTWDLIINCSDFEFTKPFEYPEGFQSLGQFDNRKNPTVLEIGWPDFEPPKYSLAFWCELWRLLVAHASGKESYKVYLCCTGGHGRSATAAGALYFACGVSPTPADAIKSMRGFCEHFIETKEQESYLLNLLQEDWTHDDAGKIEGTARKRKSKKRAS